MQVCSSLAKYWKMPTRSTWSTAHGPRSPEIARDHTRSPEITRVRLIDRPRTEAEEGVQQLQREQPKRLREQRLRERATHLMPIDS